MNRNSFEFSVVIELINIGEIWKLGIFVFISINELMMKVIVLLMLSVLKFGINVLEIIRIILSLMSVKLV